MKPLSKTLYIALIGAASLQAETIVSSIEAYRATGSTGSIGDFTAAGSSYSGGSNFRDDRFGAGISDTPNQFRGFALFDLGSVITEVDAASSIVFESSAFSFINGGGVAPDWTVEVVSPRSSIANINVEFFGVYSGNLEGTAGTFDPNSLTSGDRVSYDITTIVQGAEFDATDRYLWIRFRPSENGQIGGVNTVGGFSDAASEFTLTIVPEPSSYAFFVGVSMLACLGLRRPRQ